MSPSPTSPRVARALGCVALGAALAAPAAAQADAEDPGFAAILRESVLELDARDWGVGRLVPDLAFEDVEGRPGRLSDYADREALVIVMRQIGCPVCNRYGPRLARLEQEYAARDVAFLYVNMDTYLSPEEVQQQEVDAYGFQGRYAHDPEQLFGRTLGVQTTTDVFVLDAARTLCYRGAVDDQYGRGVTLPEARNHFLRDALESVLVHEQAAIPATTAPGCRLDVAREEQAPVPGEITFEREVSRILQQHCVECHREGGAGPFSLETYEHAYDKRRMIRLVVSQGIMPPWYAADDTGPWKNDRRLSAADRQTVVAWVDGDAPRGDAADAPIPLNWHDGWQIGEPDVIFRLDEEKQLPAEGVIDWDPILGDRVVPEDIWIQRLQILPTSPQVVHHVLMFFQPPDDYGRTPKDALVETLVPWRANRRHTWQFLAGVVPGSGPRSLPPGVARFVPKGSRLLFDMHYTPNGKATTDRTMLGLVLAKDEDVRFVSQMRAVQNFRLRIPPHGKAEYTAELELPRETLLRSLNPHMHLRGTRFLSHITYPDGRQERLIELPVWDPDWQFSYYFDDAPVLPAGTRIWIKGWFDNTTDNLYNPDPDQEVRGGRQIWDEMLYMALDCIQPRADVDEILSARGGAIDHPIFVK